MRQRVTILGSTGSIGRQALDVVRSHPGFFEVVGLSAGSNVELLKAQAQEFHPRYIASRLEGVLETGDVEARVVSGAQGAATLAAEPVDVVLNGIVGFAGLTATVSALQAGNTLALANKESLVAGGEWVMKMAKPGQIIPVDSEHSAIFQCLTGRDFESEVNELLLTASGGPFFEFSKQSLADVGPEDALKHPTWDMGAKITIDSATMMNKGLEVIEAHHLFGVPYDDVRVVVHRQSIVHGGAVLADGAVILHASLPDMRLPIAYALLYPKRVDVGANFISFKDLAWTFQEPRNDVFRCLPLAIEAGRAGGPYPIALNAANEVAVGAFLEHKIGFLQIADIIETSLEDLPEFGDIDSMQAVNNVDRWARERAGQEIPSL